ncbi:MAG: hypothetical protein ABI208_10080 [Ginsengibacter sp.]
MKKSFITLFTTCLLVLVMLFFTQCKKESASQVPVNIILYDKPLFVIQSYIQGSWKLQYGKGGFCGSCIQYYDSSIWKFTNINKIIKIYGRDTIVNTTIDWVKGKGTFINDQSTYIMNFYDKWGYPSNYVVDNILNDTLILHDNSSDAVFYHFTKMN